jgi:hypothetical protein
MLQFADSILDALSAFSGVLRPLSDFYLSLLRLTNIVNGWLKPIADLLDSVLRFLR